MTLFEIYNYIGGIPHCHRHYGYFGCECRMKQREKWLLYDIYDTDRTNIIRNLRDLKG